MTAVERANFNAQLAKLRRQMEDHRVRLMLDQKDMQRVIDKGLCPLAVPHLRTAIRRKEDKRESLERSKGHLTAVMELATTWPVTEDRPAEGTKPNVSKPTYRRVPDVAEGTVEASAIENLDLRTPAHPGTIWEASARPPRRSRRMSGTLGPPIDLRGLGHVDLPFGAGNEVVHTGVTLWGLPVWTSPDLRPYTAELWDRHGRIAQFDIPDETVPTPFPTQIYRASNRLPYGLQRVGAGKVVSGSCCQEVFDQQQSARTLNREPAWLYVAEVPRG